MKLCLYTLLSVLLLSFLFFDVAKAEADPPGNENEYIRSFLCPEYSHNICNGSVDNTEFASYCSYKNPDVIPRLLSDADLRTDSYYESCGDSDSLYASCDYITLSKMYQVPDPLDYENNYQPLFVGYFDGQIDIIDSAKQEVIQTLKLEDSPPNELIGFPINNTDVNAVFVLTYGNKLQFHKATADPKNIVEDPYHTVTLTEGDIVAEYPFEFNDNHHLALHVRISDTEHHVMVYTIPDDGTVEKKETTKFQNVENPFISLTEHRNNFLNNETIFSYEESTHEMLIVISQAQRVDIFQLNLETENTHDFDNEGDKYSMIYQPHNESTVVVKAMAFGEYFRRAEEYDKNKIYTDSNGDRYLPWINPYPSNQLILVVILDNATHEFDWEIDKTLNLTSDKLLAFFSLSEFRKSTETGTFDNPQAQTQNCPSYNEYFMYDSDCQLREYNVEDLEYIPKFMSITLKDPAEGNSDEAQLFAQGKSGKVSTLSEYYYSNSHYHVLHLGSDDQYIDIYAIQAELCEANTYSIRNKNFVTWKMSRLQAIGPITSMYVTPNSQHTFFTITRKKWEIKTVERFGEICADLEEDRTDIFLQSYLDYCDQLNGIKFDSNNFAQYSSSCTIAMNCPSDSQALYYEPPKGWYTYRPTNITICPKGHFCRHGSLITCPKGYYCPDEEMGEPIKCVQDTEYMSVSCEKTGLSEVGECYPGEICRAPYEMGLGVPAGKYVDIPREKFDPTNIFKDCTLGDFCYLGAYQDNDASNSSIFRDCPEGYYCETTEISDPVKCDCSDEECYYCPSGSYKLDLCPAGYYCRDETTKIECEITQYCPAGATDTQACTAGYYCPSAAVQKKCTAGNYCPEGSVEPKSCPFFVYCGEGEENLPAEYVGYIVDIVVLGVLGLCYYFILKYVEQKRKEREIYRKFGFDKRSVMASVVFSGLTVMQPNYQVKLHSEEEGSKNPLEQERSFYLDFEFDDLGLTIKGRSKKVVLKGVTGKIFHGSVTAIMGPSGAGKTTFLNTLCGKASYGIPNGTVKLNGYEESITEYKKVIGFVPQEDIMMRELTVKENMLFSAKLRLDRDMPKKDIKNFVSDVIKTLGLWDVRHSPIGDETKRGVSGGQRKRVNAGLELVANPVGLFLDEPTSGLDSTSSMDLCRALRNIADAGINVMAVIHQPRYEIFMMFHNVLLLGKGGRTVYLGPTEHSLGYFEHLGFRCPEFVNPADFMMDVIAGNERIEGSKESFEPTRLFTLWNEEGVQYLDKLTEEGKIEDPENKKQDYEEIHDTVLHDRNRKTAGFFRQSWEFFIRSLVQQTRDVPGFIVDLVLVYIAGLFLGVLNQDTTYIGPPPTYVIDECPEPMQLYCSYPKQEPIGALASLTALAIALTSTMASLKIFGKEKVVYWRESASGLNSFAYFVAKNFASIPSQLLQPAVFLSIYYALVKPRISVMGLYGVLLLIQLTGSALGQLISVLFPASVSQLAAAVIVLISSLVSGLNPPLKEVSKMVIINIFHYTSFLRYAQEAFFILEIDKYDDVYNLETTYDLYGYDSSRLGLNFGILITISVLFRVFAYLLLRFKDRDKQV
ncbi:abc transporter g family member 28 [Anaeramoeba flamelloides]|uniref:Abc transporter g family member 28 n=1 Tax=Anaeramoeba flamelloides TaxID=1746091 RepID=A0ABQ8XB53_9EUKA|nr:abc transporter g family member 28 [Anaeramoeba flamelloides]